MAWEYDHCYSEEQTHPHLVDVAIQKRREMADLKNNNLQQYNIGRVSIVANDELLYRLCKRVCSVFLILIL